MVSREAVRKSIKELSNQLGFTLFIPHSKCVEPTDKAKEIYPQIKDAVQMLVGIESPKDDNVLKIAVAGSSAELFIKLYLKEFYAKHSDIQLEISKRECVDILKQKQLDLVIDVEAQIDKAIFRTTELFKLTGTFAATLEFIKKHNVPSTILKDDLFKLPIISRKGAWQEFLTLLGIDTNIPIIQSASTDMTLSMTMDSIGIGLLPKELLKVLPNNNLVELNVQDLVQLPFKVLCGYTKNLSNTARAFIDGLVKYFS